MIVIPPPPPSRRRELRLKDEAIDRGATSLKLGVYTNTNIRSRGIVFTQYKDVSRVPQRCMSRRTPRALSYLQLASREGRRASCPRQCVCSSAALQGVCGYGLERAGGVGRAGNINLSRRAWRPAGRARSAGDVNAVIPEAASGFSACARPGTEGTWIHCCCGIPTRGESGGVDIWILEDRTT